MKCPECGAPLRIGSRLCSNCGAWLGEPTSGHKHDASREPSPPPPAPYSAMPGPREGSSPTTLPTPTPVRTAPIPTSPPAAPPPSGIPLGAPPTGAPPTGAPPTSTPNLRSVLGAFAPPVPTQRVEKPAPPGEESPRAFDPFDPFDDLDDIDEMTTLSTRRSHPQQWTLTMPDGRVELVTERIIVGRHPELLPLVPFAKLVPVSDPTRSVSKNHACFSLSGANLIVEDLGSTNGIVVRRPDGHEHDIGIRGHFELEVGSTVELGDVIVTVGKV